ncbi:MAG: TolC family protein, partial [Armatimonadetes bacterium]|nr:TolC family protein [Armatimonadota bacterium]
MRGSRVQSGFKAGVVLSFPLGDGGRRSAETKEQRKMLAAIAAQHHALENKIASEVSQAWAEWSALSEVKAAADAEFKASDEAYRVALIRYQEGKSILAELTDARSQLTHARLSVAEATQYERKSSAKLARAVGSLS